MEFQEAVKIMRPADREGGSPRFRWKFSFHRPSKSSSSSTLSLPSSASASASASASSSPRPSVSLRQKQSDFPAEFVCLVSGSVMVDPVIVPSGHSFERAAVEACKSTGYVPTLNDGSKPDFSAVIPNLALKSAILSHCKTRSIPPPEPLDVSSAEKIVRELAAAAKTDTCESCDPDSASQEQSTPTVIKTEYSPDSAAQSYSSSDESAGTATSSSSSSSSAATATTAATGSTPPPQLLTRPSCCSSFGSSSEIDVTDPSEEEYLITKLKSPQIFEVEEAVICLRRITRSRKDCRASLCTHRLLLAVRSLIVSKYSNIQVNAVAALVNLSLEKVNKVKIMRSGILPNLVEVLKSGSPEGQEHAAGAVFSLALDDHNKIAIGVLGALPPLVDMLRSATEQAQNDSALALYHLTLMQTNCIKLIRMGSVQVLLGMLRSGQLMDRVLLIVCNVGAYPNGRSTLLDSGAIECLLGLLDRGELNSASARDNCLNALLALSKVGLRFKGLAKAAGAMEILKKMEIEGSRNKASVLLDIILERSFKEHEDEEVDWEKLLESSPPSPRLASPVG
ncbi:U-box domain-containing protein 40-like [Punica granatum]|uniref:RING-type E3 ubiquitin transferase n=2 Tax=Punica granatum TaxID=22663 RepID=A0A218WFF9_PUNGR|nr:U-box domain-containing protein 40-like [Punica granatum]OWM71584.1 hypothetical protein CDL15_Pgr005771 [Punica granatum]PKI33791.1 hypothetical protein CRG98_045822 [Punica granatum]